MIDEDVSRRTIALSIRTGKLSARVLAYLYFIMPARRHKCCERLVNPVPKLRASMTRREINKGVPTGTPLFMRIQNHYCISIETNTISKKFSVFTTPLVANMRPPLDIVSAF